MVTLIVMTQLVGCGGSSSSASSTSSGLTASSAASGSTSSTDPSVVALGNIGPAGGSVSVTSGEMAGTSVTIPRGALSTTIPITVQKTSPLEINGIQQWGPALAFGPPGTKFAVPVTISLPIPPVPEALTPASFLVLHSDGGSDVKVLLPNALNDGDTRISVQTDHFSTFQTGVGGFRVTIVNNSGLPDDQVFVTQYGKNLAGSSFYYCTFDQNPMQPFTNNAATPVSTKYSRALTSLVKDDSKPHTWSYISPFDNMHSGRIFVSLKGGINIGINSGGGFAEQSFSGQPGLYTPSDFMELDCSVDSRNIQNIFVNTTNVDAFGLALSMDLSTISQTYRFGFDRTKTRAQIIQAFQSMPAAFLNGGAFGCFVKDGNTVVRVLAPVQLLALNKSGALATLLDSEINAGYTQFTGSPLNITYQGFAFSGQVQNGNLVMTCNQVPDSNPTTGKVGDQYVFPKPSTEICFQGTDPRGDPGFSGNTDNAPNVPWYNYTPNGAPNASAYRKDAHNKLTALITAAVVRGVFPNLAQWSQPATYYKTAPSNSYSDVLHQFSERGLCYGFGYDDIYEQAPAIGSPLADLANTSGIVITIPAYP